MAVMAFTVLAAIAITLGAVLGVRLRSDSA